MVEEIQHQNNLLAIIIKSSFKKPGLHFFSPQSSTLQLGYMCHPAGKIIQPHVHNEVKRQITITQEVLLIKKGVVRVDFYDQEQNYLENRNLYAGDVILLVSGGHGFQAIEDVEIIEVKQGPYIGDADKTKFKS